MNRDASAIIIAFIPAIIMILTGNAGRSGGAYLLASAATAAAALLVYHLLRRWHHPGIVMLLAVGVPAMFHVYLATHMPILLPVYYAVIVLVAISSCLGAQVSGQWHWQGAGINACFFTTVLLAVLAAGACLGRVYAEAGLLAAGAFGITRLCNIDLLSWMRIIPQGIHKLMEKVWY